MARLPFDISGISELRYLFFRWGIELNRREHLMEELAQYAMFAIKKRTSEGKDADDNDFIPYSSRYSLFRAKKGRPTSKVDLFFSGSMMAAMTSKIDGGQIDLYFLNTSDNKNVKNPLKAFFLNENRNFFALSEEDIESMVSIVEDYISDLIR